MTHPIKPASDVQIREADTVVLVDNEQPGWQEIVWSAPIGDGLMNSTMLQIVEIAVDSRDRRQVEAARERVGRIKGNAARPHTA